MAGSAGIEIVQPSTFGQSMSEDVAAEVLAGDLFAVLSFNLLGVEAKEGPVNWDWMERCLRGLEGDGATAETLLLRTWLSALRSEIDATEAIRCYERVRASPEAASPFTFDGVIDRSRVDAYYDPFGNLTISQRTLLEIGRERAKLGEPAAARQALEEFMQIDFWGSCGVPGDVNREKDRITQKIRDNLVPEPPIRIESGEHDGKQVIAVYVERGTSPPYGVDPAKTLYYVRRGATTFSARQEEVRRLGQIGAIPIQASHGISGL